MWITPAFPKLIYVLEEDNVREGTPYYYLTKLAAQCTAKRMVPDYISEKKMLELKVDKNGEGHCYTCMGCRSFLTPYVDPETNQPKYYGRFNQGVVTINLVDVALSSGRDMEKFWKIFDVRLDLCYRDLYGTVPISKEAQDTVVEQFMMIVNKEFAVFICDEEEKVVAFPLACSGLI